jgi:hypothetical protein
MVVVGHVQSTSLAVVSYAYEIVAGGLKQVAVGKDIAVLECQPC